MYTKAIIASALVGLATAVPQNQVVSQNANFDDLTTLPAVPILPVGAYKDLYFSGQIVDQLGVLGIQAAGIIPHSGTQVTAYGIQSDLLDGRPALLTRFADSNTESFNLKKFYYACALNTVESGASTPVSCLITASGFDKAGNGVATQQFTFTATGLLQNMNEGVFNEDFKNLDHVDFDTDAEVSEVVGTFFDNVQYTVNLKK